MKKLKVLENKGRQMEEVQGEVKKGKESRDSQGRVKGSGR